MKHLNKLRVLSFLAMLMIGGLASTASAQNATIAEPDSTAADLMYLVDADNSLRALPQESGQMEHHKTNWENWLPSWAQLPMRLVRWGELEHWQEQTPSAP